MAEPKPETPCGRWNAAEKGMGGGPDDVMMCWMCKWSHLQLLWHPFKPTRAHQDHRAHSHDAAGQGCAALDEVERQHGGSSQALALKPRGAAMSAACHTWRTSRAGGTRAARQLPAPAENGRFVWGGICCGCCRRHARGRALFVACLCFSFRHCHCNRHGHEDHHSAWIGAQRAHSPSQRAMRGAQGECGCACCSHRRDAHLLPAAQPCDRAHAGWWHDVWACLAHGARCLGMPHSDPSAKRAHVCSTWGSSAVQARGSARGNAKHVHVLSRVQQQDSRQ